MNDKALKIADRMRRLCSHREYCSGDISRKIRDALGQEQEYAEEVLEALIRDGYIDDARYARSFARDKSSLTGWGPVKIRHALSMKGISASEIAAALKEIDSSRAELRLEKLLENRYRALEDDPMCRLKLLRFGLGRGYGYEEVSSAVERLMRP